MELCTDVNPLSYPSHKLKSPVSNPSHHENDGGGVVDVTVVVGSAVVVVNVVLVLVLVDVDVVASVDNHLARILPLTKALPIFRGSVYALSLVTLIWSIQYIP
jgi:hypothetical protein